MYGLCIFTFLLSFVCFGLQSASRAGMELKLFWHVDNVWGYHEDVSGGAGVGGVEEFRARVLTLRCPRSSTSSWSWRTPSRPRCTRASHQRSEGAGRKRARAKRAQIRCPSAAKRGH
jgi:hypothetical protein